MRSYLNKHYPNEVADALNKKLKAERTTTTQKLLGILHLNQKKKKKVQRPANEYFRPEEVSTTIELAGIDQRGVLNTITRIIGENSSASITDIALKCADGLFSGLITLNTNDNKLISHICAELRKVHEIERAARR